MSWSTWMCVSEQARSLNEDAVNLAGMPFFSVPKGVITHDRAAINA